VKKLVGYIPVCLLAWLLSAPVQADELLMARVNSPFPEAMNLLQYAIRDHGYTISRIQRVDVGLTSSGYSTAEYRLVFFSKPEEITSLPEKHPAIAAYLPLNIVIFAEGDDTIILTANPLSLETFFNDPGLHQQFGRWEKDIRAILDQASARQ
jgi:uncharacterized protein (DUF302 family)